MLYGVVLSARYDAKAMVKVEAPNQREARKAAQAVIRPWRLGRIGGSVFTGVYVNRLSGFLSTYAEKFITLDEARERLERDGFIDMQERKAS